MAEQIGDAGAGEAGPLAGRTALVTGGASGIGLGIAQRFLAAGARVLLADRDGDAAATAAARLGAGATAIAADVTDEDAVRRMVAAAAEPTGRLDVAVNCAGYGAFSPLVEMAVAAWREVLDVCLTGVFLGIKHEAPAMSAGGSIINIASLNARQPAEGMSAYCSAKAAVAMLTQVAALELGPRGIRVNAIGPGLIQTPATGGIFSESSLTDAYVAETALGRYGLPEDVADTALFLAADASRWMTGQTLYVDGGASLRKYPELFRWRLPEFAQGADQSSASA